MARPIGETPTLYGEEACEFFREMKKSPNKKQIDAGKKIDSIKRKVLFDFKF